MGGLVADDLLGLWERASCLGPVERALALAAAAGADPEVLRDRPMGRTHGRLLDLRETLLGSDLTGTAACPGCLDRVEFGLDLGRLRAALPEADSSVLVTSPGGERHAVDARPPTPADLLAVAHEPDAVAALRRRCLTVTATDGRVVDSASLSREVLDSAEDAMADADPLAEVLVGLVCPACGNGFDADVDLGAFVWAEIDAAARRLLHEVDVLARAYGWTEPEVLALSEARRAAYLGLVVEGAP